MVMFDSNTGNYYPIGPISRAISDLVWRWQTPAAMHTACCALYPEVPSEQLHQDITNWLLGMRERSLLATGHTTTH